MPRETLDKQARNILDEVLALGGKVEQALLASVDGLLRRDAAAARRILDEDRLINDKRFAIENAILIVMATQQPMARDLRQMAAILEVITELERMGDYAKGIAKVTLRLGSAPVTYDMSDFTSMANLSVGMLRRALQAFADGNARAAHEIPDEDHLVDELYNKVYRDLVNAMIANPDTIDQANLLMWVAHNLERTADRVTNICERTVFCVTGELMEMDTGDEEETE